MLFEVLNSGKNLKTGHTNPDQLIVNEENELLSNYIKGEGGPREQL